MNKLIYASGVFILMAACAGLPFFQGTSDPALEGGQRGADASAQVAVELQDVRFDGETVSGRLLIGTAGSSLRLDGRVIENIHVTTEAVTECTTGAALSYMVMDVLAPAPRKEDILELAPGYWYGKDVRLQLFDGRLAAEQKPECIDAQFEFRALGGNPTARLRVHAVRVSVRSGDGGLPVVGGNVDAGTGQ